MTPTPLRTYLDECRALADAATPGPWNYEAERYSAKCIIGIKPADDRWLAHFQPEMNGEANALLACASRTAIPRLLEMVEKAVGCLDHFRLGHGTLASVRVEECLAELSALAGKGK